MDSTPMASLPGNSRSRKHTRYLLIAPVLFAVVALSVGFLSSADAASSTIHMVPTGGTNATSLTPTPITSGNISSIQSVEIPTSMYALYTWPDNLTAYDENKYVEYTFASPDVPAGAVIDSVSLTHTYYVPGTPVSAAKIEVWDGTAFTDVPLSVPSVKGKAGTVTDTKDITSLLSTPDKVNAAKVRFLAYGNGAAPIRTGEDYLDIDVAYHTTAPTAANVTAATNVSTPVTIALSGADAGNAPLTYSIVQPPADGTLGTISGGQVTYTPTGAIGTDTFTYKVNNGTTDSDPATATITLVPGVLNSLAVSASPTSVLTGAPVTLTVTAYDSFGNVLTNDSGTSVTVTSTGANVSIDTPTATLSSGVATFTVTATSQASDQFTVTAGSVTSPAVTILFSDPTVISGPSNTTTATPTPPDAAPNPGTYSGTQSLALSSQPGTSIHYTLDGSFPDCNAGAVYSNPISVSSNEMIQAVSCEGTLPSSASSFSYVIQTPVASVAPASATVATEPLVSVVGDVNGDGKVNADDVTAVMGAWGTGSAAYDINKDSKVDIKDFNLLMVNWTE